MLGHHSDGIVEKAIQRYKEKIWWGRFADEESSENPLGSLEGDIMNRVISRLFKATGELLRKDEDARGLISKINKHINEYTEMGGITISYQDKLFKEIVNDLTDYYSDKGRADEHQRRYLENGPFSTLNRIIAIETEFRGILMLQLVELASRITSLLASPPSHEFKKMLKAFETAIILKHSYGILRRCIRKHGQHSEETKIIIVEDPASMGMWLYAPLMLAYLIKNAGDENLGIEGKEAIEKMGSDVELLLEKLKKHLPIFNTFIVECHEDGGLKDLLKRVKEKAKEPGLLEKDNDIQSELKDFAEKAGMAGEDGLALFQMFCYMAWLAHHAHDVKMERLLGEDYRDLFKSLRCERIFDEDFMRDKLMTLFLWYMLLRRGIPSLPSIRFKIKPKEWTGEETEHQLDIVALFPYNDGAKLVVIDISIKDPDEKKREVEKSLEELKEKLGIRAEAWILSIRDKTEGAQQAPVSSDDIRVMSLIDFVKRLKEAKAISLNVLLAEQSAMRAILSPP